MNEENHDPNKSTEDEFFLLSNGEPLTEVLSEKRVRDGEQPAQRCAKDTAPIEGPPRRIPFPGICAACGQPSEILLGYHCLNRWMLPGREPRPPAEGWCGRADHTTYLCGNCINAMFRQNPPKNKPVILVDSVPDDPCNRFEYILRADLEANKNGEQARLEKIRGEYAPRQPVTLDMRACQAKKQSGVTKRAPESEPVSVDSQDQLQSILITGSHRT
jgi:hypothetical protein